MKIKNTRINRVYIYIIVQLLTVDLLFTQMKYNVTQNRTEWSFSPAA